MIRSLNDAIKNGAVAQLGEHLLCKQGVTGSIPVSSTKFSTQYPVLSTQLERGRSELRCRICGFAYQGCLIKLLNIEDQLLSTDN